MITEKTDILVVGGGGREHAIIKKLSESPRCGKLYACPGNAGIAELAECIPVKATDIEGIVKTARERNVGLVFVAPDDPLMLGAVNRLNEEGIRAFGPVKEAAELEGSKVFSKGMMKKYGIPTASYEVFDSPEAAFSYIKEQDKYPVVIKADGLALGKGAIIAETPEKAQDALRSIMTDRVFGDSGKRVVIEKFLTGPECTVLAFTDGTTLIPMESAQDHKRALDGDKGLNTGGMGAFSPSYYYTPELEERCMNEIFMPTVRAMKAEGREFRGVIYFQLMLTPDGPKVIEYNARFGDPEAQAVLPRLESDFIEIIDAVIDGKLDGIDIKWNKNAACVVVAASGGYPAAYETGFEITGLDKAGARPGAFVYHAGTKKKDGATVTAGGRVLGVTAFGKDVPEAAANAYEALSDISFKNMHFRRDIGVRK